MFFILISMKQVNQLILKGHNQLCDDRKRYFECEIYPPIQLMHSVLCTDVLKCCFISQWSLILAGRVDINVDSGRGAIFKCPVLSPVTESGRIHLNFVTVPLTPWHLLSQC